MSQSPRPEEAQKHPVRIYVDTVRPVKMVSGSKSYLTTDDASSMEEAGYLPYVPAAIVEGLVAKANEKLTALQAELDNWKEEYFNLCKFTTDYEHQRDELRVKLAQAEKAAEARGRAGALEEARLEFMGDRLAEYMDCPLQFEQWLNEAKAPPVSKRGGDTEMGREE